MSVLELLEFLVAMIGVIALTISGWLVSRQVRRRMGKSLGRRPADLELASLNTWMRVEQEEELSQAVKPVHPK